MFLLRYNSKLCNYVVCILQFGCSNFYTKNAPKLAILSSKITIFSGESISSPNPSPVGRPPQTNPPEGRGTPSPHIPSPLVHSATRSSRLQCSTLWPDNPKRLDSAVVDILSAIGQPTRPLQPTFHPFQVDKRSSKLQLDICHYEQVVAPSGERL